MSSAFTRAQANGPFECAIHIENLSFYMLSNNQGEQSHAETELAVQNIVNRTPHTHAYSELFMCTEGRIVLQCTDRQIVVEQHEIALVPPDILHVKLPSESEQTVWFSLPFMCAKRQSVGHQDLYALLRPLCTGREPVVFRGLGDICHTLSDVAATTLPSGQSIEKTLLALRTVEALTRLAQANRLHRSSDRSTLPHSKDIQRLAMLDSIICSQFTQELNAEQVARALYVSPRQLERIVKSRYGMTLREVIIDMRLKTAAQMLRDGDMSIEYIGQAIGFSTRGAFERNFIKTFDMTPVQYRKQQRAERL